MNETYYKPLTPAEIEAAERLCQEAEKGPWKHEHGYVVFDRPGEPSDFSMVAQVRGWGRLTDNPGHLPPEKAAAQQDANGEFLAASRDLLPRLLAQVKALAAERDTAYQKGREDLLDEQREERICDDECR